MSLLNVVNVTCDELEKTAADIRGCEQVLALDPVDAECRARLAKELAVMRRRLETLTRALHEERRMGRW